MNWLQIENIQLGQLEFLKLDEEYIISFSSKNMKLLKEFEQHIGFDLIDKSRTDYQDLTKFILSDNEITDIIHTQYDGYGISRNKLDSPIPLEKWIKKENVYYGYIELSIEDYSCYGLV